MKQVIIVMISISLICCNNNNNEKYIYENKKKSDSLDLELNNNNIEEQVEYKELKDNQYDASFLEINDDFRFYPHPYFNFSNKLDTIDNNSMYYGLYEVESSYHSKYFILKEIRVGIIMDDRIGLENYYSEEKETPLYLFKGIHPKEPYKIHGKTINRRNLFPGDNFYIHTKKGRYFLYVTGETNYKDTVTFGKFVNSVDDMELHVQESTNGSFKDTILFRCNMRPWSGGGYEGAVNVHWIGDLDVDGRLDMILGHSGNYAAYEYSIFLSTNGIFKVKDKYMFSD